MISLVSCNMTTSSLITSTPDGVKDYAPGDIIHMPPKKRSISADRLRLTTKYHLESLGLGQAMNLDFVLRSFKFGRLSDGVAHLGDQEYEHGDGYGRYVFMSVIVMNIFFKYCEKQMNWLKLRDPEFVGMLRHEDIEGLRDWLKELLSTVFMKTFDKAVWVDVETLTLPYIEENTRLNNE